MISTNVLSVFLLHHHLNRPGNKNICSVQEVMRASQLEAEKLWNFCKDFPNVAILTKSSPPGEIQLTFSQAAVGNKSLGESIVAFALADDPSSPSIILFNIEIAFATDSKNICLLIVEFLLCSGASDPARSKKQRNWTSCNAILLPKFSTYAAILHGDSNTGELLKIFARSIKDWTSDADPLSEANKARDNGSILTIEAAEAKIQARRSRNPPKWPPPRRWPPSQTIATESWSSYKQLLSNLLEFSRRHSPFVRTSPRASGSNDVQT